MLPAGKRDLPETIKNGKMNTVQSILDSFNRAKNGNGRLHLLGLISDGGVHSHINHLFALLQVAKEVGVPKVFIHFFGDGRDTDPKSGAGYMKQLLAKLEELGIGQVATVVGRYYIMDRDKRWDRVEIGMKGLVTGEGEESTDPVKTIEERYAEGETDEFLKPIIVGGREGRVQGMLVAISLTSCKTDRICRRRHAVLLQLSLRPCPRGDSTDGRY